MNSNETRQDNNGQDRPPASSEQEHAGNSGEGAASALAHLHTQTRQHRRHNGDEADADSGPAQ